MSPEGKQRVDLARYFLLLSAITFLMAAGLEIAVTISRSIGAVVMAGCLFRLADLYLGSLS